jgi:hypothetical protein
MFCNFFLKPGFIRANPIAIGLCIPGNKNIHRK